MSLRDVIIQICTPVRDDELFSPDVYFDQNKKMIEMDRQKNRCNRLKIVETQRAGVIEMRRVSNG